ncbi:hypothetical protein PIB30_097651 [Stylosanthes scabra]|uniref:Uncharacterized protein n=1 Tax=Stylosanthes scabra TaxID=79078 RepID=A0ABU6QWL1_9FABA|nr:hypothetical protein [Stylosanthes scabra]
MISLPAKPANLNSSRSAACCSLRKGAAGRARRRVTEPNLNPAAMNENPCQKRPRKWRSTALSKLLNGGPHSGSSGVVNVVREAGGSQRKKQQQWRRGTMECC